MMYGAWLFVPLFHMGLGVCVCLLEANYDDVEKIIEEIGTHFGVEKSKEPNAKAKFIPTKRQSQYG